MPALSVSRLVSAALVAVLAAAQTVQPSNATLDQDESGSLVQLTFTNPPPAPGAAFYNVAPLTPNAGKGELESNGLGQIHDSGNVRAIDSQTETSVGKNDIAYISCDLSSSPGFIDPSDLVGKVGALTPTAILLYSLDSAECNLNGSYPFTSIYSMTSANDSTSLLTTLQQNNNNLTALIALNTSSSANGTSADGAPGGPPPTTAVAMSILYSITGIITLLFLVVIASGAIRAHRHPERYGPRAGGSTGRPRQSRAKGLARAMLETLPIVKFGDPEPVKSGDRDIEMEDGTSSVHHVPEVTGAAVETEIEQRPKDPATTVNGESGGDPTAATDEAEGSAEASPAGGELGCSICTEDFTTGEDVRVLPCHHKYHPACIDPWLLNVSGTCPLCRHDLRPVQSPGAETTEGDELPPPLSAGDDAENHAEPEADPSNDASHRHRLRVSRLLDLTRLRTAPPEERIAALRQLREQSQQENASSSAAAGTGDQQGRSARLTSRLRDKFHVGTRTLNPPE